MQNFQDTFETSKRSFISGFSTRFFEFEGDLKIKLRGKRLYPTERVKYLGVKIDTKRI